MSPHDHPTRPRARSWLSRPPSRSPAAAARRRPPTPHLTPGSGDHAPSSAVTVAIPHETAEDALARDRPQRRRWAPGDPGEQRRTALRLPSGVAGRHLESAGQRRRRPGTSTTIRDLRLPEIEASSQTIDGAWRLPTVGMDPTPVGVSDDGRTIVLVEDEPTPPPGRRASRSSTGLPSRRHGSSSCRGVRIRRSVARWPDPVRRRASRRVRPTATTRSAPSTPRRARSARGRRRRQERGRRGDGRLADRPGRSDPTAWSSRSTAARSIRSSTR